MRKKSGPAAGRKPKRVALCVNAEATVKSNGMARARYLKRTFADHVSDLLKSDFNKNPKKVIYDE